MPIKTDAIDFDDERAVDSATTQNPSDAVTTPADEDTDSDWGGTHQDWRLAADPPGHMHPAPQSRDPLAFLAQFWGIRPEISKPAFKAIANPDTSGLSPSSSASSLSDHCEDAKLPTTLLDRRVPQRGWEQEYGVPSYLIGAADILFYHRKRVANPDVAVIDAAILRLYGPWIKRHAASSRIPPRGI